MEDSTAPISFTASYPLRVAIEEIEFLEKGPLFTIPALERVVRSKPVETGLLAVRRLVPRLSSAWSALRNITGTVNPSQAKALRPRLPAGSALGRQGRLPLVWIDLTFTYRNGNRGGIARVARELAMAAARTGLALPVVMENGRLRSYFAAPELDGPLVVNEAIRYIIVDIFWDYCDEYLAMIKDLKSKGAKVIICIHDIMPLYVPSFFGQYFVKLFASTFPAMIVATDACISISNHTARNVRCFMEAKQIRPLDSYPIGSFQPGADFQSGARGEVRPRLRDMLAHQFAFLSVGTIEPRKGYAVTLDAFEILWRDGYECHWIIMGQEGWVSKALRSRIVHHPEAGKRLHWVRDASDAEVSYGYQAAYCLIQASFTEGFGLPVIEASARGAPILASDNEVFREIAGDTIDYFKRADASDLAAKLKQSLEHRPKVAQIKYVSWDESLALLTARISALLPAGTVTKPASSE